MYVGKELRNLLLVLCDEGNALQRLEQSLPVSSVTWKRIHGSLALGLPPPVRTDIEMPPCQFITLSLSLCPFELDGVPFLVNSASPRCPTPKTSNARSPTTRRSIHQNRCPKILPTKPRIPRPFHLGNTQCLRTSLAPRSPVF